MSYRQPLAALLVVALASGSAWSAEVTMEEMSFDELLARGGYEIERSNLDASQEFFSAALEAAPDNEGRAMAELGLSRVAETRGDLSTALLHARRAAEALPEDAATAFILGRQLARLGAAREAVTELERAHRLAPTNPNPPLLAALVLRGEGAAEEALELLESAWARGVDDPAIAEQIGALSLTLDRPERTIEIAQEILEQQPDRAEFQLLLGLALAKDPDSRTQAIPALRKAIALGTPNPALASLELGILLIAEGDSGAALAALREAERLTPNNPEIYYRQAAAYRLAGDRDGATRAFQRFEELRREIDSGSAEAKRLGTDLNRALALADENRLAEAVAILDGILDATPNNARAHATKGKVLYSMRRKEEALASATRARELDPSRSEHHLLEGMFLLALGRAQEAADAERRALALDPDIADAHILLGGALAKLDEPAEAASHFEAALALGADTLPLRLGYAAALEELGRDAESAEQLEAYRRLRSELGRTSGPQSDDR